MTWLKLDDNIASHHKVLRAGPEAAWLWACCIAYSTRHLTDGFVPTEALGTLGSFADLKASTERAIAVNLLESREGGVCVHDYLKHNPSAAEVRQRLAELAERGSKGGHASWAKRQAEARCSSTVLKQDAKAQCSSAPLNLDPIRSDPIHSEGVEAPPMTVTEREQTAQAMIGGWWSECMLAVQGKRINPDPRALPACGKWAVGMDYDDVRKAVERLVADTDPYVVKRGWTLALLPERAPAYLGERQSDDRWDD